MEGVTCPTASKTYRDMIWQDLRRPIGSSSPDRSLKATLWNHSAIPGGKYIGLARFRQDSDLSVERCGQDRYAKTAHEQTRIRANNGTGE